MNNAIKVLSLLDPTISIHAKQYDCDEGTRITEFFILGKDKPAIEKAFDVDAYDVRGTNLFRFFSNDGDLASELESLLEELKERYFDLTFTPTELATWASDYEKLNKETTDFIAELEEAQKWIESIKVPTDQLATKHAATVQKAIDRLKEKS